MLAHLASTRATSWVLEAEMLSRAINLPELKHIIETSRIAEQAKDNYMSLKEVF
jgi:hypothetical protein